jgi:KaiC/GvpD/RAD55 family RecA-like ATPase
MHHASHGEKCFYMSFEESKERLIEHMEDFGWNPEKLIDSGNLKIKRFLPSDIYYIGEKSSDEVMFAKDEDAQLLHLEPVTLEERFKPDFIVIDSLTAIASAFLGKKGSYRFYAERLFRFFEKIGSTNFFITEIKQTSETFSPTGVEEFLSDGVIVLYNIKRENIRERAIEVLKMRGAKHQEKIVAMKITDNGIMVYPEQEVFGGVGDK